jgi:hypothetical protein
LGELIASRSACRPKAARIAADSVRSLALVEVPLAQT